MDQQNNVDLVEYLDNALGHHCPLCFFLEFDSTLCPHKEKSKDAAPRHTLFAKLPSYATSATSSTPTIRAKVSEGSDQGSPHLLKRKSSPVDATLRQLNSKHSEPAIAEMHRLGGVRLKPSRQTLRAQQSDERLRQAYESQLLTYLDSPLSEVDPFGS